MDSLFLGEVLQEGDYTRRRAASDPCPAVTSFLQSYASVAGDFSEEWRLSSSLKT